MKNTIIDTYKFPASSMCYIHNGDTEGMTAEEITLIDKYIESNNILIVGVPETDPYFSWSVPCGSGFMAGNYYDIECVVQM